MIAELSRKVAEGEKGKDGEEKGKDEDEDDAPIAADIRGSPICSEKHDTVEEKISIDTPTSFEFVQVGASQKRLERERKGMEGEKIRGKKRRG